MGPGALRWSAMGRRALVLLFNEAYEALLSEMKEKKYCKLYYYFN